MLGLKQSIEQQRNQGYRSSAMSPLLWLCGLIVPSSFSIAALTTPPLQYILIAIGVVVLGYTIRTYDYLVKMDPKWVQSEKFQLETQKLDIIAQKGGPVILDNESIPLTEPPLRIAPNQDESTPGGAV